LWFVHIQYGEFASIFKLMGLDMPPDAAEDSVSFVGEEYAADVMKVTTETPSNARSYAGSNNT
jgi:hypothetical protein